jgi:hypothetical protein
VGGVLQQGTDDPQADSGDEEEAGFGGCWWCGGTGMNEMRIQGRVGTKSVLVLAMALVGWLKYLDHDYYLSHTEQ